MTGGDLDFSFLQRLRFSHVLLGLRAIQRGTLPALPGSSVRGAIGHALHRRLCVESPPCAGRCTRPADCAYFRFFDQSRAGESEDDGGENVPRGLILHSPSPDRLMEILSGAAPDAPYRTMRREQRGLPSIRCESEFAIPDGASFAVGVTLIGTVREYVRDVVEALGSQPVSVHHTRFTLEEARDGADGSLLYSAGIWGRETGDCDFGFALGSSGFRRAQVTFSTPVRTRVSGSRWVETPEELAGRLAELCLVRMVKLYNHFGGAGRLPFIALPAHSVNVIRQRMWRYEFERRSVTQDRRIRLHGLVGRLDIEWDAEWIAPLLCAAEVVHIGQGASYGLGQMQVRFL